MTIPLLTQSERAAASRRAVALRRERASLLHDLEQGRASLEALLQRRDEVAGPIRVRRLLGALPGIGPVRSGKLMREAGISERRRINGIGPRQKERLLALLAAAPYGPFQPS
ncbi:integration host factor, actinobacterial type [Streptomyces sp. NPDC056069]|uniref:integration host factor, actinobacterial type n=1 Tax=Streptomyces sp. NPDC056069 TaxID=3345702 RepID=UPI0035DCFF7D